MRVSECLGCSAFPCFDVKHESYTLPGINVKPDAISMVMVSEAAPQNPGDYYYAQGNPLFARTTVQAFNETGETVSSINDIVGRGVFLTTAVKCGKTGYGIQAGTIAECSRLLDQELTLFPKLKALMLMGDVAIKAINFIARRAGGKRVLPAGSTYKLRKQNYFFRGMRVFPSYLQAGPSFFIEESKLRMIAEDIAGALKIRG